MNSRIYNITRTVWVLCLLCLFVSCQDTLPQRSTISPGSVIDDTPSCEDDEELTQVADESQIPTDKVKIDFDGDIYFCKDKASVRPDNAVYWKSDFCACKDSKAVSYGNCAAFCSGKNTGGVETLFANFTTSEAISLSGLGNVYAWCNTNLPGDTVNPSCELQAKDESGATVAVQVTIPQGSNSLSANIQGLAADKTYVLSLVEKVSGAKSNSIQIIKFSQDVNLPILGPLKNAPISQFTCLVRDYSEDPDNGDVYFDSSYRLHYYFIPRLPPRPIPAGNGNLVCHDIFNTTLYGIIDDELYPRLEQQAGIFNLWDTTDPRFFDNDGEGRLDINQAIVQKTKIYGATIPADQKFFQPFPPSPEKGAFQLKLSDQQVFQALGWIMAPWTDQSTFKSYCLNSSHYNSSNPLFRALGEFIQVDTEGLYVAEKSAEAVTDSQGNVSPGSPDLLLIRETDVKAVWFYLKNGVPTQPTDDNVGNNAVFFYHPINKASPYVRTSTQRIYRMKWGWELGTNNSSTNSTNNSSGTTTTLPAHDRKLGCIPKF